MKFVGLSAVLLTIIFAVLAGLSLAIGQSKLDDIVAFESSRETDDEIYVADVSLGLVHNLTRAPTILNQDPVWSPDGRQLMYLELENGWTTTIRDVITGKTRKLFEHGHGLRCAWSPDGRWLAYIDNVGSLSLGKSGLYLMDMLTDEVRLLTDNIIPQTMPFWSPNSQKIAFVSDNQRDNYPIAVIDIDSGSIHDLSTHSKGVVSRFGVSWSPDSRQIVYTMGNGTNVFMYIADLETGHITRIDNHIGFDAVDDAPAWSPDGRQIAYQSYRDHSCGIYLVDVATWETRFVATTGDRSNPVWSPTGRLLGFTDSNANVYVADVATGEVSFVWNSPDYESNLAWSPPWR